MKESGTVVRIIQFTLTMPLRKLHFCNTGPVHPSTRFMVIKQSKSDWIYKVVIILRARFQENLLTPVHML